MTASFESPAASAHRAAHAIPARSPARAARPAARPRTTRAQKSSGPGSYLYLLLYSRRASIAPRAARRAACDDAEKAAGDRGRGDSGGDSSRGRGRGDSGGRSRNSSSGNTTPESYTFKTLNERLPDGLPEWFKVPAPGGTNFRTLQHLLRNSALHTVCEEARCPNIGDCWERKTATFMILGDVCTRACRYCAVTSGRPLSLDLREPERLAQTVQDLALNYCVITSVNRDDLPDGGSFIFSECIRKIRQRVPSIKVEVLIPDFDGNWVALQQVLTAKPNTLNHNIETVRRIFYSVRPKGSYDQSLELLRRSKSLQPSIPTKSGMMVGLGETWEEVVDNRREVRPTDSM